MWFDIIKAPNPHGGKWKFLTKEQYYEMDEDNMRRYHGSMSSVYQRQLELLRARHQHLDAAPETLQNEIIDLQKVRNFHKNQQDRIKHNREESVFSIEEDKNPPSYKLPTTPMGNLQYGEWDLTEEEYDDATREGKMKYHDRKDKQNRNIGHGKEKGRMVRNPNYISPYNPEDAKSVEEWQHQLSATPSKEEYENMSNHDKTNFHSKMYRRYIKEGNVELNKFHTRMRSRLRMNWNKPTYYSIEEERNA